MLIDDAARDLDELYASLHLHGADGGAERLLDLLERAVLNRSELPDRGATPPELLALGVREFQEIRADRYRIVYRVVGQSVCILMIADSRRDLQPLLQRRLLEA
ncbi:MAG: type II toxin-antitoxin system RelE/ParE family toxin [Trueperaceae bacterium]